MTNECSRMISYLMKSTSYKLKIENGKILKEIWFRKDTEIEWKIEAPKILAICITGKCKGFMYQFERDNYLNLKMNWSCI